MRKLFVQVSDQRVGGRPLYGHALRFYKRYGFVSEARHPDFYSKGEALTVLGLRLEPPESGARPEPDKRPARFTELFDLLATAAGPELTNESLWRAIHEIGDVEVTGLVGSLGEGKYDVRDTPPVVLEWDAAAGDFVPV